MKCWVVSDQIAQPLLTTLPCTPLFLVILAPRGVFYWDGQGFSVVRTTPLFFAVLNHGLIYPSRECVPATFVFDPLQPMPKVWEVLFPVDHATSLALLDQC